MISIWRPNPSGGTAILMRTGYRFSVSRRACIDGRIILVLVRYLFAAYNLRSAVVELALYVLFRTTRTDAAVDDRIDPAIIDFARAGLAPPGAGIRLELVPGGVFSDSWVARADSTAFLLPESPLSSRPRDRRRSS